jgi:hypothetical protein
MANPPISFTVWLIKTYAGKDSVMGDLAAHVQADRLWPTKADTENQFMARLLRSGATEKLQQAFKKAWQQYAAEIKKGKF